MFILNDLLHIRHYILKFYGPFKERNVFVLKLQSGWEIWQRLHANCLPKSRTLGVIMCPTINGYFPGSPEEYLANVIQVGAFELGF